MNVLWVKFSDQTTKSEFIIKIFGSDKLRMRMEEGIFGGLQEVGVFETYHMNWHWQLKKDQIHHSHFLPKQL